jgi:hypothetical protein
MFSRVKFGIHHYSFFYAWIDTGMKFMTFKKYLGLREGVLLPDRPVTAGKSRLNTLPATQSRLKGLRTQPVQATVRLPLLKSSMPQPGAPRPP